MNLFFKSSCVFLFFFSTLSAALPDFVAVGKKAIPAVVSIQVKTTPKSSFGFDLESHDELWDHFFGMPFQRSPKQQTGQGSGFVISSDGYIITNSHVVNGASEIKVILNDGKEFAGKLIGQDPNTDVALIKIEGADLPYLQFANSESLDVGEWVAAIGSPLGLQATLTTGVISAKGRNNLDLARIEDFIQTDAPINRGNSGGPLLNLDAEVVGMNTAIVSNNSNGGYMGIGFAIPSTIISHVVSQLKQEGKVSRGFIGVSLQRVDQDLAAAFDGASAEGALVANVEKNSPAEKAGLQQGDIILQFNGNKISNIGAFRNTISLMNPGTKATLSVLRAGKVLSIPIEIGLFATPSEAVSKIKLGFEIESNGEGVIVTKVEPGSAAEWAGLHKGSLIVAVNQVKVATLEEFNEALNKTGSDKPTLFLIKQGSTIKYISIKVG